MRRPRHLRISDAVREHCFMIAAISFSFSVSLSARLEKLSENSRLEHDERAIKFSILLAEKNTQEIASLSTQVTASCHRLSFAVLRTSFNFFLQLSSQNKRHRLDEALK